MERGGFFRLACVLAAVAGVGAEPLQAQGLELGPSLLRSGGRFVPAARLRWNHDAQRVQVGYLPRMASWGAGLNLPVTWDPHRNPESLRGELRAGGLLVLYNPPSPPPDPVPGERYGAWDYGYLSLEGRVGFDAPQHLDDADLLLGVVFRYEHDRYGPLWFVPGIRVAVDGVRCLGCDPLPGEEDDTGTFVRVDAEAAWNVPLDRRWIPDPLRPVWLRFRGRAFRSGDVPDGIRSLRREEGAWGSGEVAYRLDGSGWLHEIYVRWSGGRFPVLPGNPRAWAAGVTLAF